MRIFLAMLILMSTNSVLAQNADEKAIRELLDDQTKNWNQGNIDSFVRGYWKNDSLMFIGKRGVTYGYQNMIKSYKQGYSDTIQMGKLAFDVIRLQKLSNEYYFVVGKWFLKRTIGDLNGHYTLLFRKINGEWVIVADHSS